MIKQNIWLLYLKVIHHSISQYTHISSRKQRFYYQTKTLDNLTRRETSKTEEHPSNPPFLFLWWQVKKKKKEKLQSRNESIQNPRL